MKKQRALESLLMGKTLTEAARTANVRRETLSRWQHNDADFVAALNQAQNEQWQRTIDGLRALAPRAVETLAELLGSDSDATRLKAAVSLLERWGIGQVEPSLKPAVGPLDPEAVREQWREADERAARFERERPEREARAQRDAEQQALWSAASARIDDETNRILAELGTR